MNIRVSKQLHFKLADRFKPSAILIDDASTGTALAQEFKEAHLGAAVRLVPIERDKIGRLYVHQAKFEAGLVLFPKEASFLSELEAELLVFPQGRTDDQVDSISQALPYRTGYDPPYRGSSNPSQSPTVAHSISTCGSIAARRTSIMEYWSFKQTDKEIPIFLSGVNIHFTR